MKWNLSNIWSNCGRTLGMAMLLYLFVWPANASAEELNIYSHRQAFLINPFSGSLYRQNRYQDKCCVRFKGPCPASPT